MLNLVVVFVCNWTVFMTFLTDNPSTLLCAVGRAGPGWAGVLRVRCGCTVESLFPQEAPPTEAEARVLVGSGGFWFCDPNLNEENMKTLFCLNWSCHHNNETTECN